MVLLHGMIAAGNCFGAAYDELAENATVVVPDLLGFGGSMATTQGTDAAAHIAALDAARAALELDQRPTVVAGHSMGDVSPSGGRPGTPTGSGPSSPSEPRCTSTGLRPTSISREWGPCRPSSPATARFPGGSAPECATIERSPPGSLLPTAQTSPCPSPGPACSTPGKPISGSLNGLIRDAGWAAAVDLLGRAGIPVTLAAGSADPVPVAGRAAELAHMWPRLSQLLHSNSDHALPLTDPAWCRRVIGDALAHGIAQDSVT